MTISSYNLEDWDSFNREPFKPSQVYLGTSQISPLPKAEKSHQQVLKRIKDYINNFDFAEKKQY